MSAFPNPTSHPCPIDFGDLIAARYFSADGYVRLRLHNGLVVVEHRFVMERTLGRALQPWEIVKHANGDRADNSPRNLMLDQRGEDGDHVRRPVPQTNLICAACTKPFKRRVAEVNLALRRGKSLFYCGRGCVGRSYGRAKMSSSEPVTPS